jgi:hypothetical protein
MSGEAVIVLFLFLLVALFMWAGFLAHNRGRSVIGALILSICLTPFIAIGLVLLFGKDYKELERRRAGN